MSIIKKEPSPQRQSFSITKIKRLTGMEIANAVNNDSWRGERFLVENIEAKLRDNSYGLRVMCYEFLKVGKLLQFCDTHSPDFIPPNRVTIAQTYTQHPLQ